MAMDDIEKLKARVEKDPNSRLFLPLAEEYRKAGMLDEAISVLLKGLERQPSYTSARVALGKIYLEKKMIEDARREFEKVISAIPDNLFSHKKLAEIYRDIGELDRAIKEYRTVLEINPLDEEARAFIEGLEKAEKTEEFMEELPQPEAIEGVSEEEIRETPLSSDITEEIYVPEKTLADELIGEVKEETFFNLPEEESINLSGEDVLEAPVEDMFEVSSPVSGVEEMEESCSAYEIPESVPEAEAEADSQFILEDMGQGVESTLEVKEDSLSEGLQFDSLMFEGLESNTLSSERLGPNLSEGDGFVAKGEYFKALESYKALLNIYPDNKKILQRIAELKNLLKLVGKDEEIIMRLEAFLEGIRRRRDEFFGRS